MLSMELEYFGLHTHREPSIHHQGEYNKSIGMMGSGVRRMWHGTILLQDKKEVNKK
jgi:hypothetical protein